MDMETRSTDAISRIALLKSGGALVGGAALLGVAPEALAATGATGAQGPHGSQIEPAAGGWQTWGLSSGRQLRLPPPRALASAELAQLQALAAKLLPAA